MLNSKTVFSTKGADSGSHSRADSGESGLKELTRFSKKFLILTVNYILSIFNFLRVLQNLRFTPFANVHIL